MKPGLSAPKFRGNLTGIKGYLVKKVLGDTGPKVTAVLANSPGGLQLLPSERYGSGWLKASVNGKEVLSLPQADPYTEIYTVQDKWYRLINPEWVNPAKLTTSKIGIVFNKILDAQTFHQNIGATYHSATYLPKLRRRPQAKGLGRGDMADLFGSFSRRRRKPNSGDHALEHRRASLRVANTQRRWMRRHRLARWSTAKPSPALQRRDGRSRRARRWHCACRAISTRTCTPGEGAHSLPTNRL